MAQAVSMDWWATRGGKAGGELSKVRSIVRLGLAYGFEQPEDYQITSIIP
jgi:hypothetical protein